VGKGSFFSTKIYRDHIDILLSELGYSELVQRLFEKMTFFRVDPLTPSIAIPISMAKTSGSHPLSAPENSIMVTRTRPAKRWTLTAKYLAAYSAASPPPSSQKKKTTKKGYSW
jgi:hypothetical protein